MRILLILMFLAGLSACQTAGTHSSSAEQDANAAPADASQNDVASISSSSAPNPDSNNSGSLALAKGAPPDLAQFPGAGLCENVNPDQIEAIYSGRWLNSKNEPALPYTLILLKSETSDAQAYASWGIWKPWRIRKSECKLRNVKRTGNQLRYINNQTSSTFHFEGAQAYGKFVSPRGKSRIILARQWPNPA